jgi:CHAD domain-containing protein
MSYAFRPSDASAQAGLRRIARAELSGALKRLDGGLPDAAAVHGLRRHTKKLRGLIRLVRPVFPAFAGVNAVLRDGAARLAPLRDAEVRLATLQALGPDLPGAGSVLERLAAEVEAERARADLPAELARLAEEMAVLRKGARDWRLKAGGWDALAPGLGATWRAGRQGLRDAARAETAAPFHEWRKAVKHHWYQARLLEPLWPAVLSPWIAVVDALGEALGRHNDLDVLHAHLGPDLDPALADAITARMGQEAGAALSLGRRVYADRPGALARRWGVWWDAWRAAGPGRV